MEKGRFLYKYLLKNCLVDKYIEGIRRDNKDIFKKFLKAKREKKVIKFLSLYEINYAFSWNKSKEGYAFWYKHYYNSNREIHKLSLEMDEIERFKYIH